MVSVYVGFEASKPDLRRFAAINPDKDGLVGPTYIRNVAYYSGNIGAGWGYAFMETIKALCNASQRFVYALIRASDSVAW